MQERVGFKLLSVLLVKKQHLFTNKQPVDKKQQLCQVWQVNIQYKNIQIEFKNNKNDIKYFNKRKNLSTR